MRKAKASTAETRARHRAIQRGESFIYTQRLQPSSHGCEAARKAAHEAAHGNASVDEFGAFDAPLMSRSD